jgi:hypothetical protein
MAATAEPSNAPVSKAKPENAKFSTVDAPTAIADSPNVSVAAPTRNEWNPDDIHRPKDAELVPNQTWDVA